MIDPKHTIYAVYLEVSNLCKLQVGKLGEFEFPKGTYIYVGSAKRNIEARVNRHLKIEKPKRWHFDYLRPFGEVTKVLTFTNDLSECKRYEKMKWDHKGITVAKGFGSSDCKCETHLIYIT